jgi:hypothetical protein
VTENQVSVKVPKTGTLHEEIYVCLTILVTRVIVFAVHSTR